MAGDLTAVGSSVPMHGRMAKTGHRGLTGCIGAVDHGQDADRQIDRDRTHRAGEELDSA